MAAVLAANSRSLQGAQENTKRLRDSHWRQPDAGCWTPDGKFKNHKQGIKTDIVKLVLRPWAARAKIPRPDPPLSFPQRETS